MHLLLAFLIGVTSGLRSLHGARGCGVGGAHLGWINLTGTPLAFMGSAITVGIFSLLALRRTGRRQTPFDAQPHGAAEV